MQSHIEKISGLPLETRTDSFVNIYTDSFNDQTDGQNKQIVILLKCDCVNSRRDSPDSQNICKASERVQVAK